ncbi:hypothetical protein ACWF99_33830 [Nocardia sp. NPDC055002]
MSPVANVSPSASRALTDATGKPGRLPTEVAPLLTQRARLPASQEAGPPLERTEHICATPDPAAPADIIL